MHYIGILFGGDENLLDPYWEDLQVEPYISHTKEEIIKEYMNSHKAAIKWRKERIKNNDPKSSEYQKWINEHTKYSKKDAWEDIKKDYEGEIDENENIISTYNPNSEWDWYTIGGRWSKYFPSKEKDEDGDPVYYDEITIGEVDWNLYFNERKDPYCYITEEGDWIAKGDIGWFTSSNEKDSFEWREQFKKELARYAEDTCIVAIDFHI